MKHSTLLTLIGTFILIVSQNEVHARNYLRWALGLEEKGFRNLGDVQDINSKARERIASNRVRKRHNKGGPAPADRSGATGDAVDAGLAEEDMNAKQRQAENRYEKKWSNRYEIAGPDDRSGAPGDAVDVSLAEEDMNAKQRQAENRYNRKWSNRYEITSPEKTLTSLLTGQNNGNKKRNQNTNKKHNQSSNGNQKETKKRTANQKAKQGNAKVQTAANNKGTGKRDQAATTKKNGAAQRFKKNIAAKAAQTSQKKNGNANARKNGNTNAKNGNANAKKKKNANAAKPQKRNGDENGGQAVEIVTSSIAVTPENGNTKQTLSAAIDSATATPQKMNGNGNKEMREEKLYQKKLANHEAHIATYVAPVTPQKRNGDGDAKQASEADATNSAAAKQKKRNGNGKQKHNAATNSAAATPQKRNGNGNKEMREEKLYQKKLANHETHIATYAAPVTPQKRNGDGDAKQASQTSATNSAAATLKKRNGNGKHKQNATTNSAAATPQKRNGDGNAKLTYAEKQYQKKLANHEANIATYAAPVTTKKRSGTGHNGKAIYTSATAAATTPKKNSGNNGIAIRTSATTSDAAPQKKKWNKKGNAIQTVETAAKRDKKKDNENAHERQEDNRFEKKEENKGKRNQATEIQTDRTDDLETQQHSKHKRGFNKKKEARIEREHQGLKRFGNQGHQSIPIEGVTLRDGGSVSPEAELISTVPLSLDNTDASVLPVVSLYWGIFNNPGACPNDPCKFSDATDPSTEASILHGTGGVPFNNGDVILVSSLYRTATDLDLSGPATIDGIQAVTGGAQTSAAGFSNKDAEIVVGIRVTPAAQGGTMAQMLEMTEFIDAKAEFDDFVEYATFKSGEEGYGIVFDWSTDQVKSSSEVHLTRQNDVLQVYFKTNVAN